MAKALAEKIGDIGFVIDHQDTDAHRVPRTSRGLLLARKANCELCERTRLARDRNAAAVLLRHNVVADRQAEAGALAGRLGGEERLEQLVPDFLRNADTVVTHSDLHRVSQLPRDDRECGLETERQLHAL